MPTVLIRCGHCIKIKEDGYQTCEEAAKRCKEINQQFLCITDHGMMGAIPRQIRACEKNKISPAFGCEMYVNPMQIETKPGVTSSDYFSQLSPEDKAKFKKSNHLLAIAYTNQGYSNLVKLSSWGWLKGFYRYPRVNHEQLLKYKEGSIFTTGCYNSEIGWAFDQHGEEAAFEKLEQYISMFSPNLYLEFMLLDFKKQKPYNAFIMKAKKKYGLPIICSNDCHFCLKEDSEMQRLMLMIQTKKTIQEIEQKLAEDEAADIFALQEKNLWLKSEAELNEKWLSDYSDIIDLDIFEEAKRTTVEICQKAKGIQLDRTMKLPKFDDADDRLMEACIEGFKKRKLPQNKQYKLRVQEEFSLIKSKGFSSYFIIQKMMTDEARRISPILLGWGDGSEALGPGRGCLTGDTPIILGSGQVTPLVKVQPGDFVWTLDGTKKRVLKVMKYPLKNEILRKIKTHVNDIGVTLTLDHKIYAENGSPTGNLSWFRSDELEIGDWCFIPDLKIDSYEIIDSSLGILGIDQDFWKKVENGTLVKIRSIEEVPGPEFVYDLEVEENHNYLTSSFLVHNSICGSLLAYLLGITEVDPLKHDLLFSRFLSPARGGRSMKLRFTQDPLSEIRDLQKAKEVDDDFEVEIADD